MTSTTWITYGFDVPKVAKEMINNFLLPIGREKIQLVRVKETISAHR